MATDSRVVLDAMADAVLAADASGLIDYANPAAARLFGRGVDQLVGLPLAEPLPGTSADARQVMSFRRPDGSTASLDIATAERPDGGIVATIRDVTLQRRRDLDRAERLAQFKSLLGHLPVGVAYFDPIGVCRACNVPAATFLGRPRAEVIGVTATELFQGDEPLRDSLLRCVREHVPFQAEGVIRPDPAAPDAPRYFDWLFRPLAPGAGKSRGALALITDVTDRTLADAELQRAKREAENTSRNKTQFLSAVSHDLRTPVNALSLQAELLARLVEGREDSAEELAGLAEDIRQASTNLIELINDLLDLTRFDSGLVEHHPTVFELEGWLASTLRPIALMARNKGLGFRWSVDRPGRTVFADRVKLGRVLTNLAGNAVKFTERGEVIVAAGAAGDGSLALAVRDTGPGIPEGQRERIFDEFAQLRNPERDRSKGTGLGLAICRRLVAAVGGRLMVASELGQGSLFTALYPSNHMVDAATPEPAAPEARTPAVVAEGPILLVEDDGHSRRALGRLLQQTGYPILAAADGAEALAALARCRPSLVLLDLMMPGIDGVAVLRHIRGRPDLAGLPVIILTGDVMGGRTGELNALDVDGMLSKPVDFDELRRAVALYVAPSPKPG